MLAVAVKVAELPGQIVEPGFTVIVTVGVVLVTTEIVSVLLFAVEGNAQGSFEVSVQVITSPFANPASV